MTRGRGKWGPSRWCVTGQHGWCANRTPEESHCGCQCHNPKEGDAEWRHRWHERLGRGSMTEGRFYEALERQLAALQSIANSSCCGPCQEAANVAKAALNKKRARG